MFGVENSHYSCFSDDSDEPFGNPIHLPRRLLAGTACKKVKRARTTAGKQEEDDRIDEDDDVGKTTGGWSLKDPALVGSKIPDFSTTELPKDVVEGAQGYNAYDYYELFRSNSYAEMVVKQSKLYGGQKDLLKAPTQVDLDTYRYITLIIYFSVYFHSDYLLFIYSQINCFLFMSSCFLSSIILFAIRCTEAFLLMSGNNSIPRRKML